MSLLFTSPANNVLANHLRTTPMEVTQVEDGSLTIRTKNSVREFELDASCVIVSGYGFAVTNTVNEYFRDDAQ